MKARFALLSIAFAAVSSLAAEAPARESPLFGRWTLDVATLPMPAAARPKQVTLSFKRADEDKVTTQVEIIDQADHVMDAQSTVALDGTPAPASGTYQVDVVSAKMPEPDVLIMQFVYEGIPRSTRVYSVSADGGTLTETEAYFRDGKPVLRTARFARIADAR